MREEVIGDCRLILGDCRDILPTLEPVDAVVTDPPYGIGGGVGSGLRKEWGSDRKGKGKYDVSEDTPEYISSVIVPAFVSALAIADRAAITTGLKCMRMYPEPAHTGTLQYNGSTVMSCWGPMLWQPVLFYGKDPHQGRLRPDSKQQCNDVERGVDHPCPKPMKQWTWVVERASLVGESVLDPFMGSGTTGVVCTQTGRSFVGIEISPKYFDIACRRIEEAYKQPRLFAEPVAKPVQEAFDL